jgi:predicted MFS family arabinose efflux permease
MYYKRALFFSNFFLVIHLTNQLIFFLLYFQSEKMPAMRHREKTQTKYKIEWCRHEQYSSQFIYLFILYLTVAIGYTFEDISL